jgi:hypothetical protein
MSEEKITRVSDGTSESSSLSREWHSLATIALTHIQALAASLDTNTVAQRECADALVETTHRLNSIHTVLWHLLDQSIEEFANNFSGIVASRLRIQNEMRALAAQAELQCMSQGLVLHTFYYCYNDWRVNLYAESNTLGQSMYIPTPVPYSRDDPLTSEIEPFLLRDLAKIVSKYASDAITYEPSYSVRIGNDDDEDLHWNPTVDGVRLRVDGELCPQLMAYYGPRHGQVGGPHTWLQHGATLHACMEFASRHSSKCPKIACAQYLGFLQHFEERGDTQSPYTLGFNPPAYNGSWHSSTPCNYVLGSLANWNGRVSVAESLGATKMLRHWENPDWTDFDGSTLWPTTSGIVGIRGTVPEDEEQLYISAEGRLQCNYNGFFKDRSALWRQYRFDRIVQSCESTYPLGIGYGVALNRMLSVLKTEHDSNRGQGEHLAVQRDVHRRWEHGARSFLPREGESFEDVLLGDALSVLGL